MDFSYQKEVNQSVISCIISRQNGVPLSELNVDFKELTGYSIPYLSLGYPTLISYLTEFTNLYFIKNEYNEDTVIADSEKSYYIKKLVEKQKPSHKRKRNTCGRESPEMDVTYSSISSTADTYYSQSTDMNNNIKRRRKESCVRKTTLENLTPCFYEHQLLGDDPLLGMAEKHLMVNVKQTVPKRCGLCISGQTIQDLIGNIRQQHFISSNVIILIGLTDIINGKKSDELIMDMKSLIYELNEININATICTIPKLSCVPKTCIFTLKRFNEYILRTENETNNIRIFDLDGHYNWLCKLFAINRKSLTLKQEYSTILASLQNWVRLINEE